MGRDRVGIRSKASAAEPFNTVMDTIPLTSIGAKLNEKKRNPNKQPADF